MTTIHHFGRRLRRLRGTRSQKEIAGALKIPVTTYSSLEQQATAPRGPLLQRLAEFFGVTSQYFYPPSRSRASESAREWLHGIANSTFETRPTIATHADVVFDEDTRTLFAERLKRKLAESQSHE